MVATAEFRQLPHNQGSSCVYIKLMAIISIGGMESCLRRWLAEDEPAMTGVYRRKSQDVAKDGPVGLWVRAVNDDMRTVDPFGASAFP